METRNVQVCGGCGQVLEDGADHCPACGASVEQVMQGTGEANPEGFESAEDARERERQAAIESAKAYLDEYEAQSGNYVPGAAGALLGALVGAIPWALMYNFGYVASIIGFLIAFLAGKGYDLFKAKKNMVKFVIVLAAIVIGVFAGQVFGDVLTFLLDPEYRGLIGFAFEYYVANPGEYISVVGGNLVMSYIFAALGAFGTLRSVFAENKLRKQAEDFLAENGIYR